MVLVTVLRDNITLTTRIVFEYSAFKTLLAFKTRYILVAGKFRIKSARPLKVTKHKSY